MQANTNNTNILTLSITYSAIHQLLNLTKM